MSDDIERRVITANMEVRAGEDGEPERMVGYAIRYDQPSVPMMGGMITEYIAPGAARNAVSGDADVLALWSHDTSQVLGRTTSGTLKLTEDERGVMAEITPPAWANNYMETVKRGDVTGMSFGFRIISDTVTEKEDGTLEVTLNEVDVVEVSPVALPAYPSTSLDARSLRDRVEAERKMTEAQRIRVNAKRRAVGLGTD